MKWKVFWSPEGRCIATVEAKTARAAKRKAPMPYRKYLGEIYVEADRQDSAIIAQLRNYKLVWSKKLQRWYAVHF